MSKILAITGATGKKSGGYFAQVLCERRDEVTAIFDGGVRALVRASSNTEVIDAAPLHMDKYIGELTDVEFLKSAFADVDTVVHIAGIHWSREVVSAAAACHVRRLILVHTAGIYSKYKQAGEEYRLIDDFVYNTCKEVNIILTVLRPTMIYGNVSDNNVIKFIRIVDRLPLIPAVNGARYALQPVHYKDLGKAYYLVLMNEGTTAGRNFNLSGGKEIELRDMLSVIGQELGKKTRFIYVPFFLAYGGAWLIYLLTICEKDYREKVQRLCEPRAYPHQEATDAFGYTPMTFEEGIVDEVQEYLKGKQL